MIFGRIALQLGHTLRVASFPARVRHRLAHRTPIDDFSVACQCSRGRKWLDSAEGSGRALFVVRTASERAVSFNQCRCRPDEQVMVRQRRRAPVEQATSLRILRRDVNRCAPFWVEHEQSFVSWSGQVA